VGVAPAPDLTPAIGPAVTAVAGTASAFTGTTYNQGNASAGTFRDLMVFYLSDQATWHGYVYTGYSSSLASGASVGRSVSYTFPSPGTYYYRLCTDYEGAVSESNEGNNCSAMASVIVRPAPPRSLTYACNGSGTAVTLSWQPPSHAVDNYYVRLQKQDGSYQGYTDGYAGTSVTYSVSPGTTYGWWVHSNMGAADYDINRYSDPTTGPNVTCAGAPDLTAGPITPTSATAGQSVTLTSRATNTGNATGGSMPMLFQVSQTGALFNSPYSAIPAAGGGVQDMRASYTFPSAGTYQVRACANYNTSWTAIATESNYANNCGAWTNVTVSSPPPPPPPTCSLSASPATTVPSTLTWSSSGATSCTGTGFSTGGATSGSQGVTTSGSYLLSCPGVGGTCTDSVALSCTGATANISASPVRIQAGSTSQVSYDANGADSCTITGPGAPGTVATNACTLNPTSFTTPALTTQTTYTITCGAATDSVTINVVPKFEEF
jgi:hypothetical protein